MDEERKAQISQRDCGRPETTVRTQDFNLSKLGSTGAGEGVESNSDVNLTYILRNELHCFV